MLLNKTTVVYIKLQNFLISKEATKAYLISAIIFLGTLFLNPSLVYGGYIFFAGIIFGLMALAGTLRLLGFKVRNRLAYYASILFSVTLLSAVFVSLSKLFITPVFWHLDLTLYITSFFFAFVFLFANIKDREEQTKTPKEPFTKYEYLIILFIILTAFILRAWNLDSIPYNADEGIYYIVFNNFSDNFLPTLDSGALYIRNFFYTYMAYFIYIFSGDALISMRSVSLFFGTGVILLGYLIGRKLFDSYSGYLIAILLGLSNFLISYSIHGRHYMMSLFFYFLFFYLLLQKDSRLNRIAILIIAVILSINHEFVFLILPLLAFIAWHKKRIFFLLVGILIATLFLIQPLFLSKSIGHSLGDDFQPEGKPALTLSLASIDTWIDGGERLISIGLPFIVIISILLIVSRNRLHKFIPIRAEHQYLFILFLTEITFFSLLLVRNQIRYRGALLILFIIITGYFFHIFTKRLRQSQKFTLLLIVLLCFLSIPMNLNYPATVSYVQKNTIQQYQVTSKIFNDPLGFASISSNSIVGDYSIVESIDLDGYIIITTDMYNLAPYKRPDYIFNEYLIRSYSYSSDELCVYNNIPFITIDNIDYLLNHNDEKVMIIADSRIHGHLSPSSQNYINSNFKLIESTPSSYFGEINRVSDNSIRIYVSN